MDRVDRLLHSALLGSVGDVYGVEVVETVCGGGVARGGGSVTRETNGEDDEAD